MTEKIVCNVCKSTDIKIVENIKIVFSEAIAYDIPKEIFQSDTFDECYTKIAKKTLDSYLDGVFNIDDVIKAINSDWTCKINYHCNQCDAMEIIDYFSGYGSWLYKPLMFELLDSEFDLCIKESFCVSSDFLFKILNYDNKLSCIPIFFERTNKLATRLFRIYDIWWFLPDEKGGEFDDIFLVFGVPIILNIFSNFLSDKIKYGTKKAVEKIKSLVKTSRVKKQLLAQKENIQNYLGSEHIKFDDELLHSLIIEKTKEVINQYIEITADQGENK